MQAKSGQRASASGADAFDIRVLAFAASRPRQLQALQQVFGLDPVAAQTIVDRLPGIAAKGLAAAEAERARRALESLGAEVALEPTTKPGPARPMSARSRPTPPPPPPAARAFDPLPKPIMRMPTADLEFDMLSIEAEVDLESALNDNAVDGPIPRQGFRKSRTELELDDGNAGELDLDAPAPRRPAMPSTPRSGQEPNSREVSPARSEGSGSSANENGANSPMSRAAVVQPVAPVDKTARRSRAIVQLLAAVLVFVLGLYFDNSVLLGDASWFSVVAHGLAIQQFGSALWGFVR